MGLFLRAAFTVLEREGRPLSAKEMVDKALQTGILQTKGKTPSQTMKAKLSTEILTRSNDSLFMRAKQGKFALREWGNSIDEYVAERFKKELFDEDIVVFPASSLRMIVPHSGLWKRKEELKNFMEFIKPMRRQEAEGDVSVIQLISVFIVRHGSNILTYKRTRRLPESRLHHFYSIFFGGHLNPGDTAPLFDIFDPSQGQAFLNRELHEELRLPSGSIREFVYRGLLYDESQSVSKQHIGITYEVLVNSDQFEIGERGFLMDAKYESVNEIKERRREFENWSLLLLDELGDVWQ